MSDNIRFYVGDPVDLAGLTRSEVEDLTVEYYWQAEDAVEDYISGLHETLEVFGELYEVGTILRRTDPFVFDEQVKDRTTKVDLSFYPETH